MSSCSQTKTLSLSYNDINITLCWLNTISSHLWASNRCLIAFHRSFRLYEVSQRPYYFASTPPTCHKLFCFTMFPFSLPAVLILLADLQVDPAKWLLITQKDLYSPSLHGGLVWAIIIWDYLYLKYLHTWQARAEVSFSCTATCQQEVMLGWGGLRGSEVPGWPARYCGMPVEGHGCWMLRFLREDAYRLAGKQDKPAFSRGSAIMHVKMIHHR